MRFATDADKKGKNTLGSNSRFYKFNLIQRNKHQNKNHVLKAKNKDFQKEKFDRKAFIKEKIEKKTLDRRMERKAEKEDEDDEED
jgi:hypothetical protein